MFSRFTEIINSYKSVAAESMMKAAVIRTPGGPEQLYVGEVPRPGLKPGQVLIRVHATAINRADTLQRQGKYPVPAGESQILGLEAAGVVEDVSEGTTRWKKGDRVMALLAGGGNAEFATAYEGHVMPVPDNFSFVEAAAIPEVWLTAYQLLHFVGHAKPGESVLIHAAASGVGTAAVQLSQLAGLQAYATAGSQEKIDLVKSLGAVDGFNYKEKNFAERVIAARNGKGVDLVLDCVGASFWDQNADVLNVDGRWVLYGSLGGLNVEGPLLAKILGKRISLTGSTLRARSVEYKTNLVSEFSRTTLDKLAKGTLKPIIAKVFPLDQISAAHQLMESNANSGKIIIQVIPGEGKSEL